MASEWLHTSSRLWQYTSSLKIGREISVGRVGGMRRHASAATQATRLSSACLPLNILRLVAMDSFYLRAFLFLLKKKLPSVPALDGQSLSIFLFLYEGSDTLHLGTPFLVHLHSAHPDLRTSLFSTLPQLTGFSSPSLSLSLLLA